MAVSLRRYIGLTIEIEIPDQWIHSVAAAVAKPFLTST
jgi:hypothetical protein